VDRTQLRKPSHVSYTNVGRNARTNMRKLLLIFGLIFFIGCDSTDTKTSINPRLMISHSDYNSNIWDNIERDSINSKDNIAYEKLDDFEIFLNSSSSELKDTVKLLWRPIDTLLYNQMLYWRNGYQTIKIKKVNLKGFLVLTVKDKVITYLDMPKDYNYLEIRRQGHVDFVINYSHTMPVIGD
jgi:hypothetical protein